MCLLWDSDYIKVESYYIIFLILQCMFEVRQTWVLILVLRHLFIISTICFSFICKIWIFTFTLRGQDYIYIHMHTCVCVLVTQSCLTLCNPWTIVHQAPLSMEFSRQEYWRGLPFSSPGDLPDPGIELGFLHCRQIFYCLGHQAISHTHTHTHTHTRQSQQLSHVKPKGNTQRL